MVSAHPASEQRALGEADARGRAIAVARLPLTEVLSLDPTALAADLGVLTNAHFADSDHAIALLHLARLLEPPMRFADRREVLERLSRIPLKAVARRQLSAERALDMVRENMLDAAEIACLDILKEAAPEELIALSRATEALGWLNAWRGTAAAAARARSLLNEAAERYSELGAAIWQGNVLFLQARTVDYQRGDLAAAERGMRASLPLLGQRRQAVVLTFVGDLLGCQGHDREAREVLVEAAKLAGDEAAVSAYVTWSLAKLTSYAGDVTNTVRLIEETDRDLATLGIDNTMATFAAEASEMLNRVHERELADVYLRRATLADPDDEFVRLATAESLALRGDPSVARAALRQVLLEPWLERRLVWRVTLLDAWAALRRGDQDAGVLARRALDQVAGLGGVEVALTTESALMRGLLPLAAAAGSSEAAALLHPTGNVVRLLGTATVWQGVEDIEFPSGLPGELARLVVSYAGGLAVEEVVEAFWPDEDADTARRRLRQVLSRLGAKLPGLVERQGDRLTGSAWVDVLAFQAGASVALASGNLDQAQAALGLWGGLPLPTDAYSDWAVTLRERLIQLRVRLLDLLAADAEGRDSRDEALRHLEAAIAEDKYDESRYERAARLYLAAGQRSPARRLLREARTMLDGLGVPEPASWRSLQREIDAPD